MNTPTQDEEYDAPPPIEVAPLELQINAVEIEHDFGALPMVAFIVLFFWVASLDTEIRCALGSEKACVSLKVEAPKAKQ